MRQRMRRALGLGARVAVAAAGVALIVASVHWNDRAVAPGGGGAAYVEPGLGTLLARAEPWRLAWGLVCVGLVFPLQAVRWWVLMRCRGLRPPLWRCFALTMVGQFFNLCLPGLTGGDVARAWYAAKGTQQRATAAVSVLVDRAVGLLALAVLTAAAGLWAWDEPVARRITLGTWLALAALGLAAGVYAWPVPRRAVRVMAEAVRDGVGGAVGGRRRGAGHEEEAGPRERGRIARLFASADTALVAYRGHPWALLASMTISLAAQALCIASMVLALRALGASTPLATLAVVLPLVLLAGSLPLSLLGLGVMEGVALPLLTGEAAGAAGVGGVEGVGGGGASANAVVGSLLVFRIYLIVYAVVGAWWVVRGRFGLHPEREAPGTTDGAQG